MERYSNKLDNNLLDEVEHGGYKTSNPDLVRSLLPGLDALVTFHVVVGHGWQERDLNRKPPEEQGGWEFKLPSHVAPFLAVIREDAGDEANWVW